MRTVDKEVIINEVAKLCILANTQIPFDIKCALENALQNETEDIAKNVLSDILLNDDIAEKENVPICQDTGMAVFFVNIGEEVFINGNIEQAIFEGTERGYSAHLRASVVDDPLFERKNTCNNTPPIVHYSFVKGDKIEITICPKGFGSENKSAVKMLTPADAEKGVCDFIIETVKKAGGSPCPPIIVGVGIGGTMEKAALLSKKALTRDIGIRNENSKYAALEEKLKDQINELKIGAAGMGGNTTALSVNIEYFPTHIAGLPVAVNIGCHVTRHKTIVI